MNQCRACLRITLVNSVGLCPACDDRLKEQHPEGCIAVPLSMIQALKQSGWNLEQAIKDGAAVITEMQNDLREAVERMNR